MQNTDADSFKCYVMSGYYVEFTMQLPKDFKNPLKKMHKEACGKAGVPLVADRLTQNHNSPVWLNSFLSMVMPTCAMDLVDPALVMESGDKELQRKFYKHNKAYQMRVCND